MKKEYIPYYISVLSLIVSGIAIGVSFYRTRELSMDYMGVIVGILSLLVTSLLKFKIELCQNEETGEKSGIGVFFANMGIGVNGNSANKLSSLTSVEFSLPVEFPHIYNEY